MPEYPGVWLSPVERCVRVAEVPGSNPGTPIVNQPSSLRMRTGGSSGAAEVMTAGWAVIRETIERSEMKPGTPIG